MNKKNFNATSWLQLERSTQLSSAEKLRLPNIPPVDDLLNFQPKQYLSQGWKGEGLSNKSIIKVQTVIKALYEDARKQFKTFHTRNKSLKYSIYEEFEQYLSQFGIEAEEIASFGGLWEAIKNPHNQENKKVIEPFIEIYSYRAVIFYLYRLKLMLAVCRSIGSCLLPGDLLNPNSFINKHFQKGGSLELFCESLQTNLYSWYRPHQSHARKIQSILFEFEDLRIDEIFKATDIESFCPSIKGLPLDATKSHSISQNTFGCLVNDLIIKLPIWLKKDKFTPQKLVGARKTPKVVRTKFTGNYLDSFYQSHWYAQNNRIENQYNELICPDFVNNDFLNGNFTKYCQEVQFMTFILEITKARGLDPLSTLSRIINNKYTSVKNDSYRQISFFTPTEKSYTKSYDRIILNLTNLPKKNPHHYLVNQISQQLKELSHDGYILVFSNQKLFIPSQSDKVEQLLKEVKIEAHFNMDSLKGKGEIANYLYIFSKRNIPTNGNQANFSTGSLNVFYNNTKEACLTFRWAGELSTFQKFNQFVESLNKFFEMKSSSSASIYQSELGENLSFQFHQDAVVEGKLLSMSNTGKEQITHPNFFKNLTKSCSPFEQFFMIDSMDQNRNQYSSGLLGINNSIEEKYQIVLVVNLSNPKNIQLELIPIDGYQAKKENNGTAFFQYYGLIPKIKDIDLNIFREFFESNIGSQIIQLCLGGAFSKIKTKLKELLIPKFFLTHRSLDLALINKYAPGFQHDAISQQGTDNLISHFEKFEYELGAIESVDPRQTLSMLTAAKIKLDQSLLLFKEGPTKDLFQNNSVIQSLIQCEKQAIYPVHKDVYVNVLKTNMSELNQPISGFDISQKNEQTCLEVFSLDERLVEVYADKSLLEFIRFVLNSALGQPFANVFFHLEVPRAQELNQIIDNHTKMASTIEDIHSKITVKISNLISKQISQPYF